MELGVAADAQKRCQNISGQMLNIAVSRAERGLLDLSRFDAAPLIAFTATKETDYGTETDGRIPR
jgi:hypothetical protein